MITVGLHKDRRHVTLDTKSLAERVVDAIATTYAKSPEGTLAWLAMIADRHRTYDALSRLVDGDDAARQVAKAAETALAVTRAAFLSDLAIPATATITAREARGLAVELSRHAGLAAATQVGSERPAGRGVGERTVTAPDDAALVLVVSHEGHIELGGTMSKRDVPEVLCFVATLYACGAVRDL